MTHLKTGDRLIKNVLLFVYLVIPCRFVNASRKEELADTLEFPHIPSQLNMSKQM